nr:acetyl-CoA carboxylase 1 [Tanacetum cinerariifolium]
MHGCHLDFIFAEAIYVVVLSCLIFLCGFLLDCRKTHSFFPPTAYNLFWPRRDAADLFVAAIHGVWRCGRATHYSCSHGGRILFLRLLAYLSLSYNDFETLHKSFNLRRHYFGTLLVFASDPTYVMAPVLSSRFGRQEMKKLYAAWYERRQMKMIYSPLLEGLLALYLAFKWNQRVKNVDIENMVLGLKGIQIRGEIRTNVDYRIDLLHVPDYRDNKIHTGWLDSRIAMRIRAERSPWYLSVVGCAIYKAARTMLVISKRARSLLMAQIMMLHPVESMVVFVFGLSGLIVAAFAGLIMVRDLDAWRLKLDIFSNHVLT